MRQARARSLWRGRFIVCSPRRERTFVRLNCAAIPSGLVESELFGHEKGAFTGALIQKRGRFELADHGTLFLDEIGDIGLDLQPKLFGPCRSTNSNDWGVQEPSRLMFG